MEPRRDSAAAASDRRTSFSCAQGSALRAEGAAPRGPLAATEGAREWAAEVGAAAEGRLGFEPEAPLVWLEVCGGGVFRKLQGGKRERKSECVFSKRR